MRRRLAESNEVMMLANKLGTDLQFENSLAFWSGHCAVPELSVVLANLRVLAMMHQVHHWQSSGDPFYGDHKMFEGLYDSTLADIDKVAERAIGSGGPENVDLQNQLKHMLKISESMTTEHGTIPMQSELAQKSLTAEMLFLRCLDLAIVSMRENGTLTRGTENLLAGIEDVHESNVYLLKQRVS